MLLYHISANSTNHLLLRGSAFQCATEEARAAVGSVRVDTMPPPPPKKKAGGPSAKSKEKAAPEPEPEFIKSTGDGHKDEADPELLARVIKEPDPNKSSNINVAVRIRPPNQRELDGGAKNIVVHAESATKIRLDAPGQGKPSHFVYDFAIEADASQGGVFERIGVPIVQDAFHGFNTTMFAYGQTSSGKSFSMIGKLADDATAGLSDAAGIIPRVSQLLFAATHSCPDTHEFFVEASFLEIYNEKINDLLEPGSAELKVRESPKMGVHITGLSKKHVQSSYGVGMVLNLGFQNRTVSATKYNAESSRSHAIFELNIRQKYIEKNSGEKMSSHSKINLVDLAGSERSDKVGTTGNSLVEGNNINKSLSVLGRCIKALVAISNLPPSAKAASGGSDIKAKKKALAEGGGKGAILVPFRESVLTWYLRESLSGNSRTTMLATTSPVALNHEETASTLRYAASAKNIKTAAEKNEDPMEAKVRTLSEEIAKLKAALEAASKGGRMAGDLADMTEDERMEYLSSLQMEQAMASGGGFGDRSSRGSMSLDGQLLGPSFPMISCLNKDEMLSHAMAVPIIFSAPGAPFHVGREGGGRENDFTLNGVGIHPKHCSFEEVGEGQMAISNPGHGAVVLINGQSLEELGVPAPLKHMDRVTLGPCRLLGIYLTEPMTPEEKAQWTYEVAFKELMHRESLQWTLLSPKRRRLLDKLKEAEILYVEQANAIAIDMCTCVRFHATILLGEGTLLRKAEASVDDVLESGDPEVVIVCSVNPGHIVETREDQLRAVQVAEAAKAKEAERAAERAAENASAGGADGAPPTLLAKQESQMLETMLSMEDEDPLGLASSRKKNGGSGDELELHSPTGSGALHDDFDLMDLNENSGSGKGGRKLTLKEELERTTNMTLFEMKMDQFEELLAELKVTYSYVASLSQGIGAEAPSGGGEGGAEGGAANPAVESGNDETDQGNNTVQAIFDTVDCDGSGTIDRAELAAAFKLFDETAIDPEFCDHMMDDLLPDSMAELDFDAFSSFLVKFLQHQYYHKLEPFVSNQRLFVLLGGRDLAETISEERKKEQALEHRNAELEQENALLKKKLKRSKPGDEKDDIESSVEAAEAEMQEEGLDADGEAGVLKFMKHCGLEPFGPVLVGMGVDNISDLLDEDLVGDEELAEAGMSADDVEKFRDAVEKRKDKAKQLEGHVAQGAGMSLKGSIYENFDPTVVGLDALTEVPVIIMNARSKRKLFAQGGKKPTIFETWNKGFGAGPEEHTFKDNKWWLVKQKEGTSYVIVNAHSSRKIFAKNLRPGAVWEKDVWAVPADDTSPETAWNIIPEADGTYLLQNASSLRKLYARVQKPGDAWTNGFGAAPVDAASTDTKWYLIPDSAGGAAPAVALSP